MQTMNNHKIKTLAWMMCALMLLACDAKEQQQPQAKAEDMAKQLEKADILPFLTIEEVRPKYDIPVCKKKNCLEVDIQSISTQDPWLNQWISESQSMVIQDQIGLQQAMTLQQAINAYVKKSALWQQQFGKNAAYALHIQTRIASQRNQYILLQLIINSQQEDITVKDRGYFFVADRKAHKKLAILDVLHANQQHQMHAIVQQKYQQWLGEQSAEVKKAAPRILDWAKNDWFFDGEGIGIHYRASEIVKEGTQLDIYLTRSQTQQILKAEIFQQLL